MTRVFCDRCNKPIETYPAPQFSVRIGSIMGEVVCTSHPETWPTIKQGDLCSDCVGQLLTWLDNKGGLE